MHFSESLKKNKDFQNVYRNGKSYANRLLVMYIWENHTERNHLGISVSKKVGNSVVRSRVTRLIRESYRLNEEFIEKVKEIQMKYQQTFLSDIEKMNYISDYMIISTEYSPTSEEYIKAISDLNIKYNVIVANNKIPEMFDDYKDLYKEFMGKELKVIDNTDKIVNYYLEIYY